MSKLNRETAAAMASTPFGKEMAKYFPMAPDYINLNHGTKYLRSVPESNKKAPYLINV
jgi:hypothetical protein